MAPIPPHSRTQKDKRLNPQLRLRSMDTVCQANVKLAKTSLEEARRVRFWFYFAALSCLGRITPRHCAIDQPVRQIFTID
jgi:hypothetical protein